jgi:chromosome segregation ATPase
VRAESRILELTAELENLRATHRQLQEDHSILRKDLGQLEEKHAEVMEQLNGSQAKEANKKAKVQEATRVYIITEEWCMFFKEKLIERKAQLTDTKARQGDAESRAVNYLKQLSHASRIRDTAWADGIILGFETFHSWWSDPARIVDLNEVVGEDIPCSNEALE